MAFADNRQFLRALEESKDAVCIEEEVDWDLEVGAIVRRACEMRAPAPFFEKIKDYPPGFRVFGAPLASYRRLAIALGLSPQSSLKDIHQEYERRIEHPLKPVIVKNAPCQEEVSRDEEVDLLRFPVPMIHGGDGGRYIGTWHLVVTKDPDSDWTNWGMYRTMVYNRRNLAVMLLPRQHQGRIYFEKYLPQKKPMPFALAIGADPVCSLVATAPFRKGESEVEYAGGLRQEPVELVKCLTSDLTVPAHAEIILEGEVLPDAQVLEGPFGEFTGYRTSAEMRPVWRVKAISHRHNPILTMTNMGIPVDDAAVAQSLATAVGIKRGLKRRGVPVTEVYVPQETAHHLVVIGIKSREGGAATGVRDMLPLSEVGMAFIVVVEEDVDVFNLAEVMHSMATKCHPRRGISVKDVYFGVPFTVSTTPEERKAGKGARAVFDCTWPPDWSREQEVPPRISFAEDYPEEVKAKVLKNWARYGF